MNGTANSNSPKRVLVTGASGFVGANLTRRLVACGHEVHLIVRPRDSRWRIDALGSQVLLHEVSLQEQQVVERVVAAVDPTWVFHLAAYGAYSSQGDVATIVDTNYVGTVNLLEACLKTDFEAFVNAGSSSEYGYQDHAPNEDEPVAPNSHYAATKAAASMYCRFIARRERRRVCTLRLYSAYGPWEEPTRLLPTLLLHGMKGTLPPLVSPKIARDFVHVDDVVDAFLLAAAAESSDFGAIFNVGTGVQTSLLDLVDLVRDQMSVEELPVWSSMPDREWDTDTWVADSTAIRSRLGWRPAFDLKSGLEDFSRWMTTDSEILHRYEVSRVPPS